MTQKLKLVELDRRHNGHPMFTHRLEFEGDRKSRAINFIRARNWLQEQFGHSAEFNYLYACETPVTWAWDTEHGRRFIYITGSTLTRFILIKEQFEKNFHD